MSAPTEVCRDAGAGLCHGAGWPAWGAGRIQGMQGGGLVVLAAPLSSKLEKRHSAAPAARARQTEQISSLRTPGVG